VSVLSVVPASRENSPVLPQEGSSLAGHEGSRIGQALEVLSLSRAGYWRDESQESSPAPAPRRQPNRRKTRLRVSECWVMLGGERAPEQVHLAEPDLSWFVRRCELLLPNQCDVQCARDTRKTAPHRRDRRYAVPASR
jgi:hypothetical protein